MDRFASNDNTKLPRFNSKFYCEGSEHVDALSIGWGGENNYVVPPVSLVSRVLLHMESCAASGVLFVPFWPSAAFWPFLVDEEGNFRQHVTGFKEFYNLDGLVVFSKNWRRLGAILNERNSFFALKIEF